MPTRLLVIGLDAFDRQLVTAWADDGTLPTLRRLLRSGVSCPIENGPGLYAGTAWVSLNTGVGAGRHRRFFRRQARAGEYVDGEFLPESIAVRPFWEQLSAAGLRVAIIDAPMTAPAVALNGIHLVDWSTHEPNFERARSQPPRLVDELAERFGTPVPDRCDGVEQTATAFRAFNARLATRIAGKTRLIRDLLDRESWDLFFATYGEAHCAGHQGWHLHDPTHPQHDVALRAAVGDPLRATYVALDAALAELVDAAGPTTPVLVVSSHGMGPFYGEAVLMEEILRRIEGGRHASGFLYGFLKRAWYRFPPGLRASALLRTVKASAAPTLHNEVLVRDRRRRRFFALPYNPHSSAIRINLAGREPDGLVADGAEYRAVCDELRREMLALRDADSGAPVVAEVVLARDAFAGPYLDELPDVIVEWARTAPVRRIASPRVGVLEVPELPGRTGDHWAQGFAVALGPHASAGEVGQRVSIVDIAPTICAVLGEALPLSDGAAVPSLTAALRQAGAHDSNSSYASR